MSKKIRVIGYCRSCSGENCDIQLSKIRNYIENRNDLELLNIYIDNNMSGLNDSRDGYIKLLASIKNKETDAIICTDISRISRKLSEANCFLDLIAKNDITCLIIDDNPLDITALR